MNRVRGTIRRMSRLCALGVVLFVAAGACSSTAQDQATVPDIDLFLRSLQVDDSGGQNALGLIGQAWRDGYAPILVEVASFASPAIRGRLIAFLEDQTGQRFGADINLWRRWTWTLDEPPHPDYAAFKSMLFGQIDPRMREFFGPGTVSLIRLDEVQWGGVRINGIPPLDHPLHVSGAEADYLDDSDIVFGIVVNGEARAYPKRILGWHEMALDRIGDVELTIIYCTLCGTVLPYESESGGQLRHFGTSGLLYRSNKLFFDQGTMSLWSTFEGRPVVGPLAGQEGLSLRLRASVTTTWGEWRQRHPETMVLSLETGYLRDYSEGAAYSDYFATNDLMFDVPETDDRLRNKDEVLVMRISTDDSTSNPQPWAIDIDFLDQNPVYPFMEGNRSFLVLTSEGGANRVFETGAVQFELGTDPLAIIDISGRRWRFEEDAMVSEDGAAQRLPRWPANRAFWFGWYAQFPDTVLIQ
jgi:hypothetical protein